MQVVIVGSGKLASELCGMKLDERFRIVSWAAKSDKSLKSIVVHAGSGRLLPDVIEFCKGTGSPLLELSTGTSLPISLEFPLIHCPNVNILMLKFMSALETSGGLFKDCKISVIESHQAAKVSVPGTAVAIASYLGLSPDAVQSVRDERVQHAEFLVPEEHLRRHAIHRIEIEDGPCRLLFESRVFGSSPYADGASRIIAAVCAHVLENRRYEIMDVIKDGWL